MAKEIFKLKEHLATVISGVLVAILVAPAGYALGYRKGNYQATTLTSDGAKAEADYSVYWEAWNVLKRNFVSADKKTDKDLLYGSISGLASAFGDPHTVFFPPEEGKAFTEQVNGEFGGIGAEIAQKDGLIQVQTPLKGTPSERAGLISGDFILKIGVTSTENMDVNSAVQLIRGEPGTKVTLNVFRKDKWVQPRDIVITREKIEVPTLDTKYYDNNKIVGISLYQFNPNSSRRFYEAATDALLKGSKGIIFDLRNNPGGYLDVANELAGWFVNRGTLVVSERFKSGPDEQFLAAGNGALKALPVVILINGGSASASEILAGALRDIRGAKIVGEKSYGKGTVQQMMELKDGSSLKVTIAHWVMPSGTILDHNGITPDIEVKPTDEDIKNKKDVQLEKALEVLRAEIAGNNTVAGR
jgi:carboxyl-terminal processing protease